MSEYSLITNPRSPTRVPRDWAQPLCGRKMTRNKFRAIVILSIVAFVLAGVVILNFNQDLPPELAAYVDADLEKDFTAVDVFGFSVAFLALAANIGLLFFARWSRPVFVAGVLAATVATALAGPFVATAREAAIYEFGLLVDGFIIALAYFSEAKVYFERKAT